MAKKKARRTTQTKAPDYEQAIERLNEIIESIESGEASLEESLDRYAEGARLIRHCRDILERAEQRVEELTVDASGELKKAGGSGRGA